MSPEWTASASPWTETFPTPTASPRCSKRGRPPLPPFADREAWAAVAARPWIAERLPALRERAERLAADGPKRVRATDYLDFFRRGVRDAHEASSPNPSDLAILTAVECLEGEGRFMDALLDLSWALAEETSWVMPAHLHAWTDEPLPDLDLPQIDLRVAMVAKALAEMCCVLGSQMDAATQHWRRRVQHELQCQAVGPYLDRHFWWDTCDSNWNAVCTDGVVAAALLGDFDAATRARVLAKAARSVPRFLSGFTADGGCTEGPGYWAFGMGHFSSLCYYVDCATGGGLDLLADPVLRGVYAYPTTVVLSGSKVVNFADCPPRVGSRSGAVAWAAGRLGVDRMTALVSHGTTTRFLMTTLLDILLAPEPAAFEPPAQAFLPDLMLLVARGEGDGDERLTLAVKGGHNAEIHNHNDVGAFIIHRRGESLVCDLGSGKYVKEFFGPHRYEFLTTRSAGHNVPLVNGSRADAGGRAPRRGLRPRRGGRQGRRADGTAQRLPGRGGPAVAGAPRRPAQRRTGARGADGHRPLRRSPAHLRGAPLHGRRLRAGRGGEGGRARRVRRAGDHVGRRPARRRHRHHRTRRRPPGRPLRADHQPLHVPAQAAGPQR